MWWVRVIVYNYTFRDLDYWKSKLSSILVNKDFLTWLLIGWQVCHQPIKFRFANTLIDMYHCLHSWYLIEAEWRIYASENYDIIGSDNGLSPDRHQAIIWTNAGILLIGRLGTNFNTIWNEIHTFSFKKIHLKMSSEKRWSFCLGFNMLNQVSVRIGIHIMTH